MYGRAPAKQVALNVECLSCILKVSGSNVFKCEGSFDRSCYQVGRSRMILHDFQSIVHDMYV